MRWQIELFFKELKSTLGFHQYQFQEFAPVEGWVELALIGVYVPGVVPGAADVTPRLEPTRRNAWWQHQRTYGLCQAVRSASEQNELKYIADRLETPGGIRTLKRLIRNSFPKEYRAAA